MEVPAELAHSAGLSWESVSVSGRGGGAGEGAEDSVPSSAFCMLLSDLPEGSSGPPKGPDLEHSTHANVCWALAIGVGTRSDTTFRTAKET